MDGCVAGASVSHTAAGEVNRERRVSVARMDWAESGQGPLDRDDRTTCLPLLAVLI